MQVYYVVDRNAYNVHMKMHTCIFIYNTLLHITTSASTCQTHAMLSLYRWIMELKRFGNLLAMAAVTRPAKQHVIVGWEDHLSTGKSK